MVSSGKVCGYISMAVLAAILLFALSFHTAFFGLKVHETLHCRGDTASDGASVPGMRKQGESPVDRDNTCVRVYIPGWVAFLLLHVLIDVAIIVCLVVKARSCAHKNSEKPKVDHHDNGGLDVSGLIA